MIYTHNFGLIVYIYINYLNKGHHSNLKWQNNVIYIIPIKVNICDILCSLHNVHLIYTLHKLHYWICIAFTMHYNYNN